MRKYATGYYVKNGIETYAKDEFEHVPSSKEIV
jgi:hypothetical protein